MYLQKLEESQTGVALPRNTYLGVFITLAWDNIDRSEETTSGESTSHRVNGMAVQPRIIGPMPQRNMKRTQVQDGCQVKNLRRLLTRMSYPEEDQAISSWTGFNILIRNDKLVVQDAVGYMTTINALAKNDDVEGQ